MSTENKVAKRIHDYREKLGLSVADLAEKSGIDAQVIEAVEAGQVIPALGMLTKISRSLGQRLGTFMDDQFKKDPVITRATDEAENGADACLSGWGLSARSLAPGKPDRQMDPYFLTLPADAEGMESSHEGEELIICVSGKLELDYGGEKTLLAPGDTAYYNSVVKHTLRAAEGKPATAYGVVFMPL